MPVVPFIPAIIGGATSILGGIFGSKSSKNAGNTVQAAGDAAAQKVTDATNAGQTQIAGATTSAQDILKQAFSNTTAAYKPYSDAGQTGVEQLLAALAPGGALSKQFTAPTADEAAATPGYQFQQSEALKAGLRAASAGGSIASGGTLKALSDRSNSVASTYYQNAYNNALKTFQTNHDNTASGLMSLTNLGQFGASGTANAAQNYGNSSANNLMQGAISGANLGLNGAENAGKFSFEGAQGKAAGDVGSTNSWLNTIKGLGQAGTNAAQIYSQSRTTSSSGFNPLNWNPGDAERVPRDINGDWSYES